jgi:hypothetical protein
MGDEMVSFNISTGAITFKYQLSDSATLLA